MTEETKNKLKQFTVRGDDTDDTVGYDLQMVSSINWYLETVWHDSNKEQPVRGSTVVVWNGEYGDILTRCVSVNPHRWWAYLDDLFQKEEEVCG